MDTLIVDIKGRFAHFRKFYTNSSSLSYTVPPRTTIEGILAAIMGKERDTYYKEFSSENLKIAVRKMKSTRTIMQTLNYIKATSTANIVSPKEHTQIPFEIVTGDEGLKYRVYLSSNDKSILNELEYRTKEGKFVFSPYLGAAPFNCTLTFVDRVDGVEGDLNSKVKIPTLIDSDCIVQGSVDILGEELYLLKEKMPVDFDNARIIKEVKSYVYDENLKALSLKLNKEYFILNYNDGENKINENIVFM